MDKLTPQLNVDQLKQNIDALQAKGISNDKVQAYVNNYQKDATGNYTLKQAQPIKPAIGSNGTVVGGTTGEALSGLGTLYGGGENGIANKLKNDVQSGAQDIQNGNTLKGVAKAGLRTAGDVAGAVYAPVGAALQATGANKVFDWLGQEAQKIPFIDKLTSNPAVQDFAMKHPNAGEDFGRVMNIALGSLDKSKVNISDSFDQVPGQVKAGVENIKQGSSDLYKAITEKSPEKVDAYLTEKFQKGVKPSVGSAKNPNYEDNTLSAIKSIVDNKPNLKLVDKYGEETGKLPTNLKEFQQAIDQTKKNIFDKYDALQKQAGGQGAKVDLGETSKALSEVTKNANIQDLHPEIAKYAEARAEALQKRGSYTTQEAQDAIKTLNNSLESFYKNPSYDSASKATIDAMIANNLRSGLDATIEKSGGEGYQDLKKQYGSLKSIEKDVAHRAIVDGRKNVKGLTDFTDILSGAEAVKGILTMNPAEMVSAGAIKGIKTYYKYLNDPNVAIKKLFQTAEKYSTSPSSKK